MQAVRWKLETYINKYLELWDFYGVIQVIKKGEIFLKKHMDIQVSSLELKMI
ncbi:hypothetical protein ACFSTA_01880 [Ornithinibacillus salinisoli]|uniref:Uncharacterized protein n=1 Tax=Ornithinibacillus salinisoli TaxID=1848459 RepID=A0ABW4VTK1_9BACI